MLGFEEAKAAIVAELTEYSQDIAESVREESIGSQLKRLFGMKSGIHGMLRANHSIATLPVAGTVLSLFEHVANTRGWGGRSRLKLHAALKRIFPGLETMWNFSQSSSWLPAFKKALVSAQNNGEDDYLSREFVPMMSTAYRAWEAAQPAPVSDEDLMLAIAAF